MLSTIKTALAGVIIATSFVTTVQAPEGPSLGSIHFPSTFAQSDPKSSPSEDLGLTEAKNGVESLTPKQYLESKVGSDHILIQIAKCESGLRQLNSDGTVLTGHKVPADTGILQINKTYHLKEAQRMGLDLDTLEGNVAFGIALYESQGTMPWKASKPCWGNAK